MNELDKIFQSKLNNHTEDYSNQSWEKIQSRLISQKSKPKKLPWLWMSVLFAVVVAGIFFWDVVEKGAQESSIPVVMGGDELSGPANQVKTAIETNTISRENESLNSVDNNSVDISNAVKNETEFIDIDENKVQPRSNTIASSDYQMDATDKQVESSTVTINNNDLNTHSTTIVEHQRVTKKRKGSSVKIIEKKNIVESGAASNKSLINAYNDHQEKANVLEQPKEIGTISGLTNKSMLSAAANRTVKIRPLRTIGVSPFTTLYSDKDIAPVSLSASMLDDFRQDCPSFVTDRTGVYLDFYLSHELPFSSLKAKSEALESYQMLRSESEGPTYSFSAGARLTLMLPNGLGLKTGLNYSQVNEKFTHINNDTDMVKEVITITTVDGMEVRDTNTIVIPGTRDVASTNKYRSFDIPLLLSYEWDVRERTYMTVNGGVYLNLLFKESGKILNQEGEVINLEDNSTENEDVFKNNIGLSLFGSVGLHYRLNGNIDLIVEPNLRMVVKSATVDAYGLEHKWLTAGLITGIRYNF